jgi:hypothetical protein
MTTQKLTDLLAKVTPGEWRVDNSGIDVVLTASNGSGDLICSTRRTVFTDGFRSQGNKANSELLSLAPSLAKRVIELTAALESTMKQVEYLHGKLAPKQQFFTSVTTKAAIEQASNTLKG